MGWLDELPRCGQSGKFRHPTPESASKHVRSLQKAGKGLAWMYRCRHCGDWHVTHKGLSPQARRQLRNTIRAGTTKHRDTKAKRKRPRRR